MTDSHDRFDDLLHDALRSYNHPPADREMPLDDMWRSIEAQAFPSRRRSRYAQWLRIAAALVIGVGIGRLSLAGKRQATTPPRVTARGSRSRRGRRPLSDGSPSTSARRRTRSGSSRPRRRPTPRGSRRSFARGAPPAGDGRRRPAPAGRHGWRAPPASRRTSRHDSGRPALRLGPARNFPAARHVRSIIKEGVAWITTC